MRALIISNARILTLAGDGQPRRGEALRDLGVIDNGHVIVQSGKITTMGPGDPPSMAEELEGELIDAGGCVLMPAFVDCHTHTCWAGERFDEFEMALAGATYLDILKAGGGIMATVRAVREAEDQALVTGLLQRMTGMASLGTGTVEVKSGYGLNTRTELKMLRAIHEASQQTGQIVLGTFLGAHAIDPDNPEFIDQTINETLPAVVAEFPEIACDAYCEEGGWSLEDTRRLFAAAREHGCRLRVHTDQFNRLGMTKLAIEMGAVSVDHLEATSDEDIALIADSDVIAVMLPCSGFQLDGRYAPGRQLVDAGAAVAIATNYNPGSAPTPSMPFAIALACRKLKLTPAEAIAAGTYNAACVLGVQDQVGSIGVGKRADLQLLDCSDERSLAFELATAGPLVVIVDGQVVHLRAVGFEPGDAQ
ncbi:MAG: imidazolonepropionase [Phycisphaerales bacterium]|nr:MAG: imidazolonepropionase [Phycisphaerales bacterium]